MQHFSGGICLIGFLAGMFVLTPAPQIKHSMSEFDNWIPFPHVPNPPGFDFREYTFENVKFKLYAGTYKPYEAKSLMECADKCRDLVNCASIQFNFLSNLCYFTDWEHGTAEGNELAAPNGFHVYRKVPWSESTCTKPDGWGMTDHMDEETTNDEGATTSHMSKSHDDGGISTEYSTTEAPPTTVTTSEMAETVTTIAEAAHLDLPAQFTRLVKCFDHQVWLIALASEEACSDPKLQGYSLDVCVAVDAGPCQLTDYYISFGRGDISKRPSSSNFFVATEENSCGATLKLRSQEVVGTRAVNYTSHEIEGYNPTGFWVWEAKYCDT